MSSMISEGSGKVDIRKILKENTMRKSPFFASLSIGLLVLPLLFGSYASAEDAGTAEEIPLMQIRVDIDMPGKKITGEASAELPRGKTVWISGEGLELNRISLGGETLRPDVEDGHFPITANGNETRLVIDFLVHVPSLDTAEADTGARFFTANFMDPQAAVLLDDWCPTFKGLAQYHLEACIPEELIAVSEADAITTVVTPHGKIYSFDFPHPRTGPSLVVGPYQVSLHRYHDIELAGYFFPEDSQLAERYLDKARGFLSRYEQLLGPFPFKRFAVVENRASTGYGLPTYTLLGQQVARLPFIADTSLGHEILHSWFGNCVYVEPGTGNWSEGLTTYLSDILFREEKGQGGEERHLLAINYQSYVHKDNAIPLARFEDQTDRAARAVGYHKAAMVFHMLRNEIGEGVFGRALRTLVSDYRFSAAGWQDIRAVCERSAGRNLGLFFEQWLDRADVPDLSLSGGTVEDSDGKERRLRFTLDQSTETPYSLSVPLLIETASGAEHHIIQVEHQKETIKIEVNGRPIAITLDPDYDLMRNLHPSEFPPVLHRFFGSEQRYCILPTNDREKYEPFADSLQELGFSKIRSEGLEKETGLPDGALLVLGDPDPRLKRLMGDMDEPQEGVVLNVQEDPLDHRRVIVKVKASSAEELEPLPRKLPHYGRYDSLRFVRGQAKDMHAVDLKSGVRLEIEEDIKGIAATDLSPIERIIRDIASKQVIYVGERHDDFSNHVAELRVIQGFKDSGHQLAVGMEMFQRPFQEVLDRYIRDEIDEETFLRKSEYFDRWGYDYSLYRPIIAFCKENGIPLIALNLPKEISQKVARDGLRSLTDDEILQIPEDLDWTNTAYKDWLGGIYKEHPAEEVTGFETFYQAQILWDETMARGIHEYLISHPGTQVIVLAGNGHVAYGYGIPSRTYRRGRYDQTILSCVDQTDIEPEMADYFLVPRQVPPPFTAKLGVLLKAGDKGLSIKTVVPQSPAEAADLRAGDLILSLDGEIIRDLTDLKLALSLKKEGDTAKIMVKRVRWMAPDKILELAVGPFASGSTSSHGALGAHRHGGRGKGLK
jgi:aminopeptidase N